MKLLKYPKIQIIKISENPLESSRIDLNFMKDKTTVHTHTHTHTQTNTQTFCLGKARHTFSLDNFLSLSLHFVTFI